jgi:peptidoglycan/LPS O-acetylase OafA/YrhL
MSPYSIEFILGAFSALLVSSEKVLRLPVAIFYFITGAVILMLPVLFTRYYSVNPGGIFIQAIIFGIAFSLLVIAVVAIEKKRDVKFPAFLVKTGDVSYSIYLSHVLILGLIGRLWAAYFQRPLMAWDNLIIFPLMLFAVISYSIVAFHFIEHPSYNFFVRILSKQKKEKLLQ